MISQDSIREKTQVKCVWLFNKTHGLNWTGGLCVFLTYFILEEQQGKQQVLFRIR